jgi:hypothetical protein
MASEHANDSRRVPLMSRIIGRCGQRVCPIETDAAVRIREHIPRRWCRNIVDTNSPPDATPDRLLNWHVRWN